MMPKEPKKAEDASLVKKAEFVIMMNWDDKRDIDMDLWVMYNNKKSRPVFFDNKKEDHIILEHDDRGLSTDLTQTDDGKTKQIYINEEIISIRGIVPGEYIINANAYSGDLSGQNPLDVTIKIIKLNPYQLVDQYTHKYTERSQERTYAVITIDETGKVSSIKRDQIVLARFRILAQ